MSASRVPAGNLIFSPLSACSTSCTVKLFAASLIGSIQTLILNSLRPPTKILPTFFTLEKVSIRYSQRSHQVQIAPSSEDNALHRSCKPAALFNI